MRWTGFLVLQALLVGAGLELVLRLVGPRVPALRLLLHQETVASDSLAASSLGDLLDSTARGFRPCEVEHGFVLSSRGFRTQEYETRRREGTRRILLLGDSQTYGVVPLANHWGNVLARELEAAHGEPVEVLNLGVPGTGLPFYVRLWELEGRRLDPDLVIVTFYLGNDLLDGLGTNDPGSGWSDRLAWKSRAYRALRNLIRIWRDAERAGAWEPSLPGELPEDLPPCGTELASFAESYRDDESLFGPEAYLEVEASRMAILHRDNARRLRDHLDQVRGLLHRLAAGVAATDARLVVLLLPDEFQVDGELARMAAASVGEPLRFYDLDAPRVALRGIGQREGILVLDPLPRFRRVDERLFRPRETHLNRAGNRLLGRYLAESLSPLLAPDGSP